MGSVAAFDSEDPIFRPLTDGLPHTKRELAVELMSLLKADGYAYLKCPISTAGYEAVAGEIGTILSRTDVRIDKGSEIEQEKTRVVKGRPGRYRPEPVRFHTDNVRVDVMGMYCVRQDSIDGSILLLDTSDVSDWFTAEELAVLSRTEFWAPDLERPGSPESFSEAAPVLRQREGGYRVYYIPWLRRDDYESRSLEMLGMFADYVKRKEDTGPIRLPIRPGECVFIDNHRMLHGRGAISEESQRHMVRLYIEAAAFGV